EAMMKDTLECAREPCLNVKCYLENAYIHPVFYNEDTWDGSDGISDEESQKEPPLVATKRPSRTNTPARSQRSESSRTLLGVTDERSCP
nr:CSC1-like protein At3g21620 [Tanacetum cinerariifolium]